MILRLVNYSEIIDTIGLIAMIHIIYFFAQVYFKQDWMVIEHVLLFLSGKNKIKKH